MLVFNSSSYITDYLGSPSPNSRKIKICMERNGLTLLNFHFCFCTFNDTTIYPDTNLYVIVAVANMYIADEPSLQGCQKVLK